MSSMRNAVQRRNHKERAQPKEREKWGLLEKHRDYSLRARDYNAKKSRLKILRQKAEERNPDEFYYGMLSSKSKGGRKIADRGNPVLSHDAVKLLKTQDSGYLQTMIQKTRLARERLEEEFVLTSNQAGEVAEVDVLGTGKGRGQKIVYVKDEDEQRSWDGGPKAIQTPLSEASGNEDEDMGVDEPQPAPPKSSKALEKEDKSRKEMALLRKRHRREQDARRTKLAALKVREKDLRDAEQEVDLQRAKMNNNVGGVTKAGVKWKVRERKR